jgi:predicted Zn-dependent peptidase
MFQAFAETGPTAEELANAKKQFLNALDTEMREPSYWFSILRNYDQRGRDLAVEKSIREDYETYTSEQVRDIFKKYYTPVRKYRVAAVPSAPDAAGSRDRGEPGK